jgi:hypothetical protein
VLNVAGLLITLFRSDNARTASRRDRARPTLEALEDRLLPAQNFWIGPPGGFWSNPANWSTLMAPGPNDIITFTGRPGGANTSSVDNIPRLSVKGFSSDATYTATVTMSAGVRLNVASNFLHYGSLVLNGNNTISAPLQGISEYGTASALGSGNTLDGQSYILNQQASLNVPGSALPSSNPFNLTINGAVLQQGTLTVGTSGPPTPLGSSAAVHLSGPSYTLEGVTTLVGSLLDYSGSNHLLVTGTLNLVSNPSLRGGSVVNSPCGIDLFGTLTNLGGNQINSTVNNAGLLQFVGTGVSSLTITGCYNQMAEGSLNMRIATAASDSLQVWGIANLGGHLNVSVLGGGDTPGPGASWSLISALGGLTGEFDSMSYPDPPAGSNGWAEGSNGTSFVLSN